VQYTHLHNTYYVYIKYIMRVTYLKYNNLYFIYLKNKQIKHFSSEKWIGGINYFDEM